MPQNNPIVLGQHVSSYSSAPGAAFQAPAPALPGGAGGGGTYNVPAAVIIGICLVILLALRILGFRFVASAAVTAH